MTIEEMKRLYETGEWILVKSWDNIKWNLDLSYAVITIPSNFTQKLIHKKHEDILNAYLEDNSVEIERYVSYNGHPYFWEDYNHHCWIENYDYEDNYRLKPKLIDLNNTDTNNMCSDNSDTSNDSNSDEVNPHCPSNFGFEPKEGVEIYFKDSKDWCYGLIGDLTYSWGNDGKCFYIDNERMSEYDLVPIKKKWYEDESNFPTVIYYTERFSDDSTHEVPVIVFNRAHYDNFYRCSMPKLSTRLATKEEVLKLIVE